MFNFLTRKKQHNGFAPEQEIDRLLELSPFSALVTLLKSSSQEAEREYLGKAFFLRRDRTIYTEGNHLYITTPDSLKINRDRELVSQLVSLQFLNRSIPYQIQCQIIGHFRLLPEVVETLDFKVRAAYKLLPVVHLEKKNKRQFYRYTLKNYGDSRIPLTTHISFDCYLKNTNKEFSQKATTPIVLSDLQVIPCQREAPSKPFNSREAINYFREIMIEKPSHERFLYVSKIIKSSSQSVLRKKDEELILGKMNLLGLEIKSLRDVIYLKKSPKSTPQKSKDNPYSLRPGENILTHFIHANKYYQMQCEVLETRIRNEVVRPLEFPAEESGLPIEVVDYSVGGLLIESSPELLELILGDKCPPNVDKEMDFKNTLWEKNFTELTKPMFHLTFYPKFHFPDAVKRYQPELPFKFTLIAQIVRTYIRQTNECSVLQHGLQFAYEPQQIPLTSDELVDWRYTRHFRENEYFKRIHSNMSGLYGYLENQSIARRSNDRP